MRGLKNVKKRWGDALSESRWDEFEVLLADYYRGQGFQVEHSGTGRTGGTGFDGGIDLKLRKDDRFVIVQCKHWNAKQVPHNEVHQLIGLMVTNRATDAILVTSGEFTAYARESAAKVGNIELIDGHRLREILGPLMPDPNRTPMLPPEWQPVAEKYAGDVVDAVLQRLGGSRRRPQSAASGAVWIIALKALLPLLLFLGAVVIFNQAIKGLARPNRPAVTSQAVSPVPPPIQPVATPVGVPPPPAPQTLSPYIPPPRGAPKQVIAEIGAADEMMTPEELAEWKRKNAESMKVLEATTRELQH